MFGLADYMNALDVRQYLYCLTVCWQRVGECVWSGRLHEPSRRTPVPVLSDILSDDRESESVFGLADYMNPLDVRQYLYCLTYCLLAGSLRVCLVWLTT